LKKNKSGNKHSKINGKLFLLIFSTSLFTLFSLSALLTGCRLLFFPGAAHVENKNSTSNSVVWEESVSSPDVLGLIESSGSICSKALYSFYDNIAEQLKLFKNKTSQSEIETQEVAAAAGETGKQQEASEGQAESQESAAQEQQQNQQEAEQQAGTPGQAEDFTTVLISLINNTRNSSGLQLLSLNSTLNSIAKSRCDDMIARDYFSHVSPEGKDIKSFVDESGIIYKVTGENLQYCSPPSIAGPELFFNTWMESETHRANMLDSGYTQIGIALSFSADKAIAVLVFLG
jgi:uncharacterized protein YkwD